MEMDSQFEKVTKWYTPEDGNQDSAFNLLVESVKNLFLSTKHGIHFFLVPKFLEDQGVVDKALNRAGFQTLSHFLFHCDELLEVRGKKSKSSGKIVYFLFIQEKVRRVEEEEGNGNALTVDVEDIFDDEDYHHTTFPAAYFKVLNLYREILIEPEESATNFCVKVKGKDERAAKKARDKPQVKAHTDIAARDINPGRSDVDFRESASKYQSLSMLAHKPRTDDADDNQPIVRIERSHVFERPDAPHYRHRVVFH